MFRIGFFLNLAWILFVRVYLFLTLMQIPIFISYLLNLDYPCPIVNFRKRNHVFSHDLINKSVLKLFNDFYSWAYRMQSGLCQNNSIYA